MNFLDWIIIIYAALGALSGFRRGFLALAISLAGYIVAYLAARAYYPVLMKYVDSHYHLAQRISQAGHGASFATTASRDIVSSLCFLAIIVAVEVFVSVLAGGFTAKHVRIPVIGPMNRLFGLILGTAEHIFIASIALMILAPFVGHTPSFLGQWEHQSHLYQQMLQRFAPPFGQLHG